MTAPTRERQREFEPVYHHYGPHRAGLPPLIPYFRELWHRRAFAAEMSKATMRGANTSTFFGQLWLVLNPLLLAAVYYLLVTIIRGRHDPAFFAHLCLAICSPSTWSRRRSPRGATLGDQLGQAADEHAVPAAADPAVGGAHGVLPVPADDPGLLRLPPHLPDRRVASRRCCWRCTSWARWSCSAWAAPPSSPRCRSTSATPRSFLPFFVRIWMYLSPVLWTPEHVDGQFAAVHA